MNREEVLDYLKHRDMLHLSNVEYCELIWEANKHLYKERPVTINEFIDSTDFVKNKWNNVYPIWRETLNKLYPTPFTTPYNEVLVSAAAGAGKELSNDSGVLTPNGWVEIGNIKVGDIVCGTDGNTYIVEGVYPQGTKPIYNVCFSDGTVVKAGAEHLWTVQNYKDREKRSSHKGTRTRTLSTAELMRDIRVGKDNRLNYSIDYIKPCYFNSKEVKIDPYLLGMLIGDGSLFGRSIGFTNSEDDIIERVSEKLKVFKSYLTFKANFDYYIANSKVIRNALKEYNLHDKHSWEKHIPRDYLYNSVDVRLKLLQGLVDADGHVDGRVDSKRGHSGLTLEYSTSSEQLAIDVVELVRSLGGRATYTSRMGKYKKDDKRFETRTNYRVNVSFCNGVIPYSSKKHLTKYRPEYLRPLKKYITDIIPNGEAECTCIKVSAPNHLFITDGYNATHNTTTATIGTLYDMYRLACLKDPCKYYNLTAETMLIFAVFSATGSTASVNWQDITTGIEMCPWLNEKVIDRRGLEKKHGSLEPVEICKGLYIQTGSKFQHSMGKAIFDGLMDEAAFGGDNIKEAQKTYNELSSRMATRFRSYSKTGNLPGHLFLISSPKDSTDFMQYRIEKAKEAGARHTLILQNISSWDANPANDSDDKFTVFVGNEFKEPKIYEGEEQPSFDDIDYLIYPPISYLDNFKQDLLGSIMNYGGIATISDVGLFKSPSMVNGCMMLDNPFKSNIIQLPFDRYEKQLMDYIDIDYTESDCMRADCNFPDSAMHTVAD